MSDENATATVEFVIAFPLVLTIMLSAIDFGTVMLRQVYLERSVDMAVRDIRLGLVTNQDIDSFRQQICSGTMLLADCNQTLTIEPIIIDTTTFDNLSAPIQCVNRDEQITPQIQFTTGNGAQELMMVRVCAVADPFLASTGLVMGMHRNSAGDYLAVARSVFVNEPNE